MNNRYVAGFDIDGVIGDFVSSFRLLVRDEYGVDLTEEHIRGHELSLALGVGREEALGLVKRTLEHPGYVLYSGALAGLQRLVDEGVEVHIVTARWNGQDDAATLTERWLEFRGLTRGVHYQRIDAVKEGAKYAVQAHLDCFVDDNLVELIEMAERRPDVSTLIVYDHPWNHTVDVRRRFRRVGDWNELVALILRAAEVTSVGHQAAP